MWPVLLLRLQAVLQKGPHHLFNLGRTYARYAAQQAVGVWSEAATGTTAFLRQLNLAEVQTALNRRERAAALTSALQHFRARPQPQLGAAAAEVVDRLAPACRAQTLASADAVSRGEFQFRGQPPITFGEKMDWFLQPANNTDWRWELNRHVYFVTLGRAFAYSSETRYVQTFARLLHDWLDHNPPAVNAPNWMSVLEVAYRANAWAWALTHFRAALDDESLLACLRGLWLHARYLAANLEYSSPNNHLWLESKALAMLGILFPEFRDAGGWVTVGLNVLWREVQRQILADGVHVEQATLYHRILASELAELLIVMEDNGLSAPVAARRALAGMLRFELAFLKPNGEPPLIGDSTLTDSYLRFNARLVGAAVLRQPELAGGELDEATLWLIGPARADWLLRHATERARPESQAFARGGYCVMRSADRYLIFDCGPFGYPLAPGHAHCDALSFELFAAGHTWLMDPGVYSYHLGADWRRFFRSTAAHNTLVVDGQDQTRLLDDWRVGRQARARLREWLSTPHFDFADAEHDGYMRLAEPVVHRRQILFLKPEYVIVFDQVSGVGAHQSDVYFHLAPEIEVYMQPATGLARLTHREGATLWLAFSGPPDLRAEVVVGSVAPIQGWVSRHSGEKQAAPVLRLSSTAMPFDLVTVLLPTRSQAVTLARLPVYGDGPPPLEPSQAICVRIATEEWRDEIVLDRRAVPGRKMLDDWDRAAPGRVAGVRRTVDGETILRRWGFDDGGIAPLGRNDV
jgi:uncharacterized heparinase superfamily protein